jgi:hypothetical protein
MPSRVFVGRDVDVIRQADDDVELVGKVRLRPGFVIDIVPGRSTPVRGGPAVVCSWRIRVLGRFGPIYRGVCRWCPSNSSIANREQRTEAGSPKEAADPGSGTGLDAPRADRGTRR